MKRWPDPLDTQAIIGDAVNTQGVGHVIDIQYLTTVLREVRAEALIRDAIDTQGIGDAINTQGIGEAINTQGIRDAIDTQGIGDAIDIRYSTNCWRRDRYPILNKSSETRLIFNTA